MAQMQDHKIWDCNSVLEMVRKEMGKNPRPGKPTLYIQPLKPVVKLITPSNEKFLNPYICSGLDITNINEFEIRFGKFESTRNDQPRFYPGVMKDQFHRALTTLTSKSTLINDTEDIVYILDNDYYNDNRSTTMRIIDSFDNQVVESKQNIAKRDNVEWGYRLSTAIETRLDNQFNIYSDKDIRIMRSKRPNYYIVDKNDEYNKYDTVIIRYRSRKRVILNYVQVDFTIVYVLYDNEIIDNPLPIYEIEIEIIDAQKFDKPDFRKKIILELNEIIGIVTSCIQNVDIHQVIPYMEGKLAIDAYNSLLLYKPPKNILMMDRIWSKPVNIKIDDILKMGNELYTTAKLDGERGLLFFYDGIAYLLQPPFICKKIGTYRCTKPLVSKRKKQIVKSIEPVIDIYDYIKSVPDVSDIVLDKTGNLVDKNGYVYEYIPIQGTRKTTKTINQKESESEESESEESENEESENEESENEESKSEESENESENKESKKSRKKEKEKKEIIEMNFVKNQKIVVAIMKNGEKSGLSLLEKEFLKTNDILFLTREIIETMGFQLAENIDELIKYAKTYKKHTGITKNSSTKMIASYLNARGLDTKNKSKSDLFKMIKVLRAQQQKLDDILDEKIESVSFQKSIKKLKKSQNPKKEIYKIFPELKERKTHIKYLKELIALPILEKQDVEKIDVVKDGIDISNTLIDGEFYKNEKTGKYEFHMFDTLFVSGTDMRQKMFIDRYDVFNNAAQYIQISDIQLFAKRFHMDGDFYDRCSSVFEEIKEKQNDYKFDGIILQNLGSYSKTPRKWKEQKDLTIDFLVLQHNRDKYGLYVKDRRNILQFKKMQYRFNYGLFENKLVHNQIIEFGFINNNGLWIPNPIRFRTDRDQPNNLKTAQDVFYDVLNPIAKETLIGTDYVTMRRYHNNIKDLMLIAAFKPRQNIIDVGSGKGGDLSKWNNIPLGNVFVSEFNQENLNELNNRYDKLKNKGTVVTVMMKDDVPVRFATKNSLKRIQTIIDSTRIDGITAFFCLTFIPKDEDSYNLLLRDIENLVPIGGKFVGIVMDGSNVRKLLGDQTSYNEGGFKIKRLGKFTDSDFGNRVAISLKDSATLKGQEEYLFPFNRFVNDMKEIGFSYQNFGINRDIQYRNLYKGAKVFSSLDTAFIFSRFIPKLQRFIIPKENEIVPIQHFQELLNLSKRGEYVYAGIKETNMSLIRAIKIATSHLQIKKGLLKFKLSWDKLLALLDENLPKSLAKQYKLEHISHTKYIDALADFFQVNVYILNSKLEMYASSRYQSSRSSVLLLSIDGIQYMPILFIKEDDIRGSFSNDTKLIKNIQNEPVDTEKKEISEEQQLELERKQFELDRKRFKQLKSIKPESDSIFDEEPEEESDLGSEERGEENDEDNEFE